MITIVNLFMIYAVFITIISYIYWKKMKHDDRLSNYLSIISLASIIMTFGIYYIDHTKQEKIKYEEEKKNKIYERTVQNQVNYFIEIDDRYLKHYPYLERIHDEIYGTPKTKYKLSEEEYEYHEIHMSLILIEAIENTLNTIKVVTNGEIDWTTPDNKEWLETWKVWFHSAIVRKYWNKYNKQFSSETVEFINTKINI